MVADKAVSNLATALLTQCCCRKAAAPRSQGGWAGMLTPEDGSRDDRSASLAGAAALVNPQARMRSHSGPNESPHSTTP